MPSGSVWRQICFYKLFPKDGLLGCLRAIWLFGTDVAEEPIISAVEAKKVLLLSNYWRYVPNDVMSILVVVRG
jgi:hypothetical protein